MEPVRSINEDLIGKTKPSFIDIEIPEIGIARVEPDSEQIREIMHEKATMAGMDIDFKIDAVDFLQTPRALMDHVSMANEDLYASLNPLVKTTLNGVALGHRWSPAYVRDYILTALPLSGECMYLNTPKTINAAVKDAQFHNGRASENLTMTAINQYLNFHLENSIDTWLRLSDPRLGARAKNMAEVVGPIMTPMLISKMAIGALPVGLLWDAAYNHKVDLSSAVLFVGGLVLLNQTGWGIYRKLQSPNKKEAKYLNRPMFKIDF